MNRLPILLCSIVLLVGLPAQAEESSKPELVSTTAGKGGGKQWNSIEELQKAADAGDPVACYDLGEMHLAGQQVPRDVAKAVVLLERAADAGNANAAFRLGKLNADGEIVPKNLPEAFARYEAAATAGVAEAQFNLGAMYASGRGVKRNYVEGLAWLIVAAKNGADAGGEQQLREHLTKAKRTAIIADAEKRAAAITQAAGEPKTAAKNTAPASGSMNAPAAARSDTKVKLGAPPAPDRIQFSPPAPGGLNMPSMPPVPPPASPSEPESGPAVKLISPIGRPVSWSSLSALERAAERRQPDALSDLGQVLLAGKLVPADPERAVLMLERGAEAGSPDAAYQLAEVLVKGVDQPKDDAKALTLYRQAAKGGSPIAMFNVGAFLANGRGAPRDYTEAFAWLLVAKKYGVERAEIEGRIRAHLEKKSPDQIAVAEQRAASLDQEIAAALKSRG
jgi:TPR repeat protein